MRLFRFWEPEETVGTAWHGLVETLGAEPRFAQSEVAFEEMRGGAGVLFRALGGPAGVEILPAAASVAQNRLARLRRLASDADHVVHARYDGRRLALPASIALFEDAELARGLYRWLAALAAQLTAPEAEPEDLLQRDVAMLRALLAAERRLLSACPGLRPARAALGAALLAIRPDPNLPPQEAALEQAIGFFLAPEGRRDGEDGGSFAPFLLGEAEISQLRAEKAYRPFRPVALWPLLSPPRAAEKAETDEDAPKGAGAPQGSEKLLKAKRRKAEQADRKDSLILHRFESILSMIEFLNVNRSVEDDDEDKARKAAEELDEVSLAKNSKSAKARLKFHLDLAPRDVDRARLLGESVYPEWDWKAGAYLPAHVRVEERLAEEGKTDALETPGARRRIGAVKRQFEALRPRRRILPRQSEGFDLDLDAAIRARCDFLATGECEERLYRALRDDARDLAVSILFDASRSTESAVSGRPVIDVAREALAAMMGGIEACGDQLSVHAFCSLGREKVFIERIKDFADKDIAAARRRVMGLTPKFYTRLGAAIRHVSAALAKETAARKLLLIVTDGKPNDIDHYEGRHGVEDARRAVAEARRLGQAVFAVTVDAKARDYIPYLFGQNGFAIVPDAARLVAALPQIYRQVVG